MLTRVVKIGGSLFDLVDLGERLKGWLKSQSAAKNILIAGGGSLVDSMRTQSSGDDFRDHWAAVEVMNITAKNLAEKLLDMRLIDSIPLRIREGLEERNHFIFVPCQWLREVEPHSPGTKLPESWDVTSDSIAARLAICIGADELVLFKSADPPSDDLQALAERGYVDRFLPKLAAEMPPWRCVNLRTQ